MTDIGEAMVAAYLREICNCDFIDKNVKINIQGIPGEIDVIGINSEDKHIYIAEVAIHTAGLQYINQREGTIDNRDRLIKKFDKAIRYANDKYKGYKKTFMFWSPVVRPTKTESGHKELTDINEISSTIRKQHNVEIQFIVNEDFLSAIDKLKSVAGNSKGNLTDPILRLYQIEGISRDKFGSRSSQKSTVASIPRTGKGWNPKAGTIGATVKQYLESHETPNYKEVRQIVLAQFPDSAFNKNHLSWYKNHTATINEPPRSRAARYPQLTTKREAQQAAGNLPDEIKNVNRDKDIKPLRSGTIKAAIMEYLRSHAKPTFAAMKNIAVSIKPNTAFNDSAYNWYLNYYAKTYEKRVAPSTKANTSSSLSMNPTLRKGTIKAAMVEYLFSHPKPKYNEMEKIALRIKPDSAFNDSAYNWYINFFNKSRNS